MTAPKNDPVRFSELMREQGASEAAIAAAVEALAGGSTVSDAVIAANKVDQKGGRIIKSYPIWQKLNSPVSSAPQKSPPESAAPRTRPVASAPVAKSNTAPAVESEPPTGSEQVLTAMFGPRESGDPVLNPLGDAPTPAAEQILAAMFGPRVK